MLFTELAWLHFDVQQHVFPFQLAEFAMKTFVPQTQGAKNRVVKVSTKLQPLCIGDDLELSWRHESQWSSEENKSKAKRKHNSSLPHSSPHLLIFFFFLHSAFLSLIQDISLIWTPGTSVERTSSLTQNLIARSGVYWRRHELVKNQGVASSCKHLVNWFI